MTWSARHGQIGCLLPEIVHILQRELNRRDLLEKIGRDSGYLIDLAQLSLHRNTQAAHQSIHDVVDLSIHLAADFRALHTLSYNAQTGSMVMVVASQNLGTSRRVFAAKTVTRAAACRTHGQNTLQAERAILAEARRLRQPFVVQIVGAFASENDYTTLLEYHPAGDLGQLLEERTTFPIDWAQLWIAQTLTAVFWLHSVGYVHRDIKPANLLLNACGHVELADFGSAASVDRGTLRLPESSCMIPVGTVDYIAPEILLAHAEHLDSAHSSTAQPSSAGTYGAEVDFWSAGVALYEMIWGSLPFYAESIPQTYERIVEHEEYLSFPESSDSTSRARDLLRGLLRSCARRLGHDDIPNHSFFRGVDWTRLDEASTSFKPIVRPLGLSNEPEQPNVTKVFDFSALFSSPGLSILREEGEKISGHDGDHTKWLGFTLLPDSDAFDRRLGEIRESEIVLPAAAEKRNGIPPITPARAFRSASKPLQSDRKQANGSALLEVVDYGILKTARKATASARRDMAGSGAYGRWEELQLRHDRLMSEMQHVESRLAQLSSSK